MLEQKIGELEKLVAQLEKENVSIEDSIKLFEKGLVLTKSCLEGLAENKGRITALKKQMDDLFEVEVTGG